MFGDLLARKSSLLPDADALLVRGELRQDRWHEDVPLDQLWRTGLHGALDSGAVRLDASLRLLDVAAQLSQKKS